MNSLLKENDISSTIIPRNMFKWKANNIHKALKHVHTIPKLTLLYFNQYPPMVKTSSVTEMGNWKENQYVLWDPSPGQWGGVCQVLLPPVKRTYFESFIFILGFNLILRVPPFKTSMTTKWCHPRCNSKESEERKEISPPLLKIFRLSFALVCLGTALVFTVAAHREWEDRRVVTSLETSTKPVAQLQHPSFTICAPAPSLEQVKTALVNSFLQWRLDKNKSLNKEDVPLLTKDFLEEKFQIQKQPFNFLDVFKALTASDDLDGQLSYGVKEYLKECPVNKHPTRTKRSGMTIYS